MEVTIKCEYCHAETSFEWQKAYGYYVFCPVCGKRDTLCNECLNDSGEECDYDYRTDSCKYSERVSL